MKIRRVQAISREDQSTDWNPQRPYAEHGSVIREDMVRPPWRHGEVARERRCPLGRVAGSVGSPRPEVTEVSVIPCRLIGGLHEWPNESATVPAWKPVKLTYWRTVQYDQEGSEDPVELYCSQSLLYGP